MSGAESETTYLLRRWHGGDRAALEELLRRDLDWMRRLVHRRLGNQLRREADTSDYVQDLVIEVIEYAPRFEITNKDAFRGLLAKIVVNLLCDKDDWYCARRRDRARERPLPADTVLNLDPPAVSVDSPSAVAQRHEAEALIRLGMDLLDRADREVLVRRDWEKMSFAQIATGLGINEEAARKRHERALTHLADKVGLLRRGEIDWTSIAVDP